MRKFLVISVSLLFVSIALYFTFIYFATYSEGTRSGELIKFSHKGLAIKTYEGELSQGISGAQIFAFSVMDSETKVIADMKELQGGYVKVTYIERYRTFPWWGDTKYFITAVEKEDSPFKGK